MASKKRSDREGSIYRRHKPDCAERGKENARCKCGWQAAFVTKWQDGKPVRKKVSAQSRAACAAKLRALREAVEHGNLPGGKVPTVGEWMTHWLTTIAAERNRPSTLAAYGTYVNRYIIPLLGHHRLDRLTADHVEAAWRSLATDGCPDKVNAKPLSKTTLHQAHVILSRALKVAEQRGYVKGNAAKQMDAPTIDTPDVEILTLVQARRVIDVAQGHRNSARWTVAFAIGLRQGEALGLRWSDVDLDAGVMYVRHSLGRVKGQGLVLGPVKSKKGERAIALPAELTAELKKQRQEQAAERLRAGSLWSNGDYVFAQEDGRPYDAKADWTLWRLRLAEAKVPTVKLHAARHTAATMMLALGVPERVVMEMLGHSHIGITHGYQKRVDQLHVAAAEKIGGALWG